MTKTFKRTLHEIFTCLIFDTELTLSDVIRAMGWGSNRDIRQKGFRIDEQFSLNNPWFSCQVRKMWKVKDPKHIISHGMAVLTNKGDRVVVVKEKQ